MPLAGIDTYHRPDDVEEAWRLLRDAGDAGRLLAGGSDLTVRRPPGITTLIDLQAAGLRDITVDDDGRLTLGAMATFTDLLEHPDVSAYAGGIVHDVMRQLGSVLHRNAATLGGHLARARMSDVVPVLLVLDARVTLQRDVQEELALADYLGAPVGPHVLTAVHLPPSTGTGAFDRLTRAAFDHSLVNAAVWLQHEAPGADPPRASQVRVAVGQTGRLATRLPSVEAALRDGALDDEAIAAAAAAARDAVTGHDDATASASFREHLAGVLVSRCARLAIDRTARGTT